MIDAFAHFGLSLSNLIASYECWVATAIIISVSFLIKRLNISFDEEEKE